MKAIGIHIFAGSFTLGVIQAGWDVVAAYENLGLGLETARQNFKFPIIYPKEKWTSNIQKGVTLAYANPPCSAFSRMGLNRGVSDPINSCMLECSFLASRHNVDIFIMESVPGLYSSGQPILDKLKKDFPGYQFTHLFSDSVIHGSPQIRPRYHFIASRYDFQLGDIHAEVPTIKDAIWDLRLIPEGQINGHSSATVSGQLEALIEFIPPGITASEIWRRGSDLRNQNYGQPFGPTRRAAWNAPGPTITGGPTIIHPDENRFITVREAARIFGYPDEFLFAGKVGNQYAQIGKAVTVQMGRFLGECARRTMAREANPKQSEKFIDLIPYSDEAKRVQKLVWYGSERRGAKAKLMEEYFGQV